MMIERYFQLLQHCLNSLHHGHYSRIKRIERTSQTDHFLQLHCNGPTGKVSRISAGFAASMGVPMVVGTLRMCGGDDPETRSSDSELSHLKALLRHRLALKLIASIRGSDLASIGTAGPPNALFGSQAIIQLASGLDLPGTVGFEQHRKRLRARKHLPRRAADALTARPRHQSRKMNFTTASA